MEKEKVLKLLEKNLNVSILSDDRLDLVIEKQNNTLVKDLLNTKCPGCKYTLVSFGNPLLEYMDTKTLSGVEIKCTNCDTDWYIHYPVVVPNIIDMEDSNVQF